MPSPEGGRVDPKTIGSRDEATSFLLGMVEFRPVAGKGHCVSCKTQVEDHAYYVRPHGETEHVGPFCRLVCKSIRDEDALKYVLREDLGIKN